MPCRFYGKNGMFGTLVDSGGNQCGLWLTSHAPCFMEMENITPDEAKCPFVQMILKQMDLIDQAGLELLDDDRQKGLIGEVMTREEVLRRFDD